MDEEDGCRDFTAYGGVGMGGNDGGGGKGPQKRDVVEILFVVCMKLPLAPATPLAVLLVSFLSSFTFAASFDL